MGDTAFAFLTAGEIHFGRGVAGEAVARALGFGARVLVVHGANVTRAEWLLDGLREAQRSSTAAIFMSLVVPGWGQLYADVPFWGTVAFATQMYFLGSILMESRRVERQSVRRDREAIGSTFRAARDEYVTEHRERARDFVWWSAAGFLIVALDAYVSVELAGFDDDDPPTPDLDREWTRSGGSGDGFALRLNFDF